MLRSHSLGVLLHAAKDVESVSLIDIADYLECSQQAAESVLKELVHEGLISQKRTVQGLQLSLTPRGVNALILLRGQISVALGDAHCLQGVVAKGKSEGRYYIAKEEYKKALGALLGGEPYSGTLNLQVTGDKREEFLSSMNAEIVKGFEQGEKSYGDIRCYHVKVAGRSCLLVMPTTKDHGEIVEIVDTVHLRSHLGLRDGDVVMVEGRK